MTSKALVAFFGLCVVANAGSPRTRIDFSDYNVPLEEQIVNHIKEKVTTRLGTGKNTRDRYFIIPFAYENRGNDPGYSHSFISVIRVFADNKQPKRTPGLREGKYKGRKFEAFTISWLPHDFVENPNLCVFEGVGSRIFARRNRCPVVPGKDHDLRQTIQLGVNVKNAFGMWGPYEISKPGFDLGVGRKRLLDKGTIKYRADDRGYRERGEAINCFHAMAGLTELFPRGGIFGTGFKMWGLNGTKRVLIEYQEQATFKHVLLEPVDIRRDLIGFVYAPTQSARGVYNPFRNAHAYHK